jgi:hypothetical protein
MTVLKYILFSPLDLILLIFGIFYFRIAGVTPHISYKAMLRLFYIYGGVVNDLTSFFVRVKSINQITNIKNDKIVEKINHDGFYVKKNFLEQNDINDLNNLVKKTEFRLRNTDKEKFTDLKIFFDPNNLRSVLYETEVNYLLSQRIIQKIISNSEIYKIAREYFNSEPFFDHVSLSISTNYNKKDNTDGDDNAAQMYHFDMDRPKWLKFLVYVTDVGENNGPHCFVKCTHKNNGIPFKFRSKGYIRLTDNDVKKIGLLIEKFVEKSGTAIIEDTRGLHKGEKLKAGYRILLNIQVNNSMFGSAVPIYKFDKIHEEYKNNFKELKNVFKYSTNITDFI